jgi:nitroreductase/NAD-dependent dihydropyrimidine dehydrogenase PreA subunit
MPLFTVDETLCLGDGFCVEACPASLVRQAEPGAPPHPLEGGAAHCIRCGHCAAACPSGALWLRTVSMDDFQPVREELGVGFEQARQLFATRRSVRNYQSAPVERQELLRLLRAAQHAPSGHNEHAVGFTVAQNRQRVEAIVDAAVAWMAEEAARRTDRAKTLNLPGVVRAWRKGKDVVARGAPHLVFVHAPPDGITPAADAVIKAAHLELLAHAMGLGACWCGYLMFAAGAMDLASAAGVPEGERIEAVLMLGRPRHHYRRIPPRPEPRVVWT